MPRADIDRWLRAEGPRYWAETLGMGDGFVEQMERAIAQRQAGGRRRAARGAPDHPARSL
jgi:hypothetical protein